jgi:hypothetical protein
MLYERITSAIRSCNIHFEERPVSDLYYDPYDIEIDRDPYPTYRRLRDEAPLYYNARHGFWALSRFADVDAALKDFGRLSSAKGDKVRAFCVACLDPLTGSDRFDFVADLGNFDGDMYAEYVAWRAKNPSDDLITELLRYEPPSRTSRAM